MRSGLQDPPSPAAPAPGQPDIPPFSPVESGWRLVAVALACLISVFLDQATAGITQAVQPYMVGSAEASIDEGTWLAISYNTAYYLSLIASPWMVSRFTRRPVWITGHALFAAASLGIALSHDSLGAMIALRALQGLGQGTFFVLAVMTVLTVFPPRIQFVGFGIFATTSLSGPAAASAIGGFFVDENNWTLAFALLALLAIIASALVTIALREAPATSTRPPIDVIGIPLAFVHYFTYHYVTQYGERRDWFGDPAILAVSLLFVVATVAFFWWELRTRSPFIKVALFKESHNLRWGALLGFMLGVPLFGGNIFLQYLETLLGFTPTLAGQELLLRIGTIVLVVPFVAYALPRRLVDPRGMIIIGFALVAASYWFEFLGTTATADFGTFELLFVLQGAGFALLFSPIASIVLTSIPPEDFTRGVAIFKLTLTTGGSFAATMLGVIFDHRVALHQAQIAGSMTLANPGVRDYLLSGGKAGQLPPLAAAQSQILSFADVALYTAILVLSVAPLALILRPARR